MLGLAPAPSGWLIVLQSLRDLPSNTTFECDLCIIGAGPASLSIARELIGSTSQVCVLESGGLDIDHELQELVGADVVGFAYHHHETRCRVLGGSTARWAGQCGPLDPQDFARRPWVEHSGWPISQADVDDYAERSRSIHQLTTSNYNPDYWDGKPRRLLDVGAAGMVHKVWQFSEPTDFGLAYRSDLAAAPNVRVLLHANATEIVLDGYARTAQGVRVRTLEGKTGFVAARYVVLACGGIENARMLLLSNRVAKNGIGNNYDLVGRYFADHPHQIAGQVEFAPGTSKDWVAAYKERKNHGARFRPGLALGPAAQRELEVLNCGVQLLDWYVTDPWNCTQSQGYRAFKALRRLSQQRTAWSHLKNDLLRFQMPEGLAPILADLATHPWGAAAGALNRLRGNSLVAFTQSEQAPNPDSRITLSDQRDRLGLRQARIDWRLQPIDKVTIRATIERLSAELSHLGLGRVRPFEWLTCDDHTWLEAHGGGNHHIGTTRMSATPSTGVVDRDCRVHGLENLYVAGSSVFPSFGFMNPTLTLTALALRLADHLAARLSYEPTQPLIAAGAERRRI